MIVHEDGSKQLVVLLIEDSDEWQEIIGRTLRGLKALVLPATNHQQAREALEASIDRLDLIILDPFIASPSRYDAHLILPELIAAVNGRGVRIIGCANDGQARDRLKTTGCTHVEAKLERGLQEVLKEHLSEIRTKRLIIEHAELT